MLKISTKHLPKMKDLEFVHVPVNQIHAYLYVLMLVNVQQIIPRMRKVIHLKENVGNGALLQEPIVWHHLLFFSEQQMGILLDTQPNIRHVM
jgi:hypothetical protein